MSTRRSRPSSEQMLFLATLKTIASRNHAPHAVASFSLGLAVLLVVALGTVVLLPSLATVNLQTTEKLGEALVLSIFVLWLLSAVGLVRGVLALGQPHGKKWLAVLGVAMNALVCVGPLMVALRGL